tara:strand:+ start:447 stop:647 length:201 start_codon:yes stop_codon:yes gene_type:complete
MDRINEVLLGAVAVVGGVLTRRVFNRQDRLEDRISALERLVVTKEDLEPLKQTTNIILEHIINREK